MTSTLIVERLAKEFSIQPEQVKSALEMTDAGLAAPFIGRVRRDTTGGLSEGVVRRLTRRRTELEELDRRRGTILRMLQGPSARSEDPAPGADGPGPPPGAAPEPEAPVPAAVVASKVPAAVIERVQACMDRFELEDLFLPHRRPEPEVQLALDRGLGALADRLAAPLPPERRPKPSTPAPAPEAAAPAEEPAPQAGPADETASAPAAAPELPTAPEEPAAAPEEPDAVPEPTTATEEPAAAPEAQSATPEPGPAPAPAAAGGEPAPVPAADQPARASGGAPPTPEDEAREAAALNELLHGQIELTPALARVCAEYVSPDRGLHTESDALAGAMRILSDRLGRDTRLRGQIRRLLNKQGVLTVRPMVEEKRLGRHKALLKLKQPLRQVQGHRLLAIRQAQKERVLSTVITLDRRQALGKVRAAIGKHTDPDFGSLLDAIALRTLEHRLLPLLEADVRLELKERADDEALRFLSQHLRQVLLTPPLGRHAVAGLDVNAKGDWTIALLDEGGEVQGDVARLEIGEKDDATLTAELSAVLQASGGRVPAAIALGQGKASRPALMRLRNLLALAGLGPVALPVNEAGLSSYASSELARKELPDLTVPQRMAVSLGRRLQDPLSEILKIDPRHLGLGSEQGLVSKANLRRAFDETIESCCAHVGCDVNTAPLVLLSKIPGLDAEVAGRLIERRAARPFESREELRAEGQLSEAQWITSVAFLRVSGSPEPLDATGLHPEQYALARRMIEATGGSVEDSLGKPGVTKGLRRTDFGVEEHVWRDLMRELWHPGRDPRPHLFRPELLDPKTDPVTLTVGRIVDGVVASVASFGAFVYIGLENDAMVHVSEISKRYVRDARELVSIGQTIRGRIKEVGGHRLTLSLKDLPETPREGGARRERRDHRGGRSGERRPSERREREPAAPVRAAQSRRDGMGGAGRGGRGRSGGRGPGRGGDRGRRDRGEERVRPEELRSVSSSGAYNPFATFFKKGGEGQDVEGSEASGKETAPPE